MRDQTALSLRNFSVSYGKRRIINNISLDLQSDQLTALLGLNGSGKTTLLRACCGLLDAESGTCRVYGEDILRMNEKQRALRLSYMPQRHSIVYNVSVMDVVLMGFNAQLGIFADTGEKERAIAREAMARLSISHFENRNFLNISEGEKQIVMLCRSLVQNTSVMLLDEPDSALDFINRHRILSEIRRQIKDKKISGIITLHDPNYALAYCDRIILLNQGKLVSDFNVHTVTQNELKEYLRNIYGDIDVLNNNGCFLMVKQNTASRL